MNYMFNMKVLVLYLFLFAHNYSVLKTSTWGYADDSMPPLADEDRKVVEGLLYISEISARLRQSKDLTSCNNNSRIIKCGYCNKKFCRVTEIDLSSCSLRGKIPVEIGNLTQLSIMDLSSNKLTGPIPQSFQQLTLLKELYLFENYLDGQLLPFLGQMKSLESLDLSTNWFRGQIPRELDSLQSLNLLYIHDNLLTGSIPPELGNLSSLDTLALDDNQLSGNIPQELGKLNLSYLDIRGNYFVGELPASFHRFTELTDFLTQGNSLSGEIPRYIANWTNLENLLLEGNNFEGQLPEEMSYMENLYAITISNLVTGGKKSNFPDLSRMNSLRYLVLRNCSLEGRIPNYIWESQSLYLLDLSFNNFFGHVPESIAIVGALRYIFLRKNKLNGTLPGWVRNGKNPGFHMDISENNFTDAPLPSEAPSYQNVNIIRGCINETSGENLCDYCRDQNKKENLHINCGGKSVTIGEKEYEGDDNPHGASTFFKSKDRSWGYSSVGYTIYSGRRQQYILNKTCNLTVTDSETVALYQTARVAPLSLKYYAFCLRPGSYNISLNFAEIGVPDDRKGSNRKPKRLFDISIKGEEEVKEVKNFNINEAAKGDAEAIHNFTNVQIKSHLVIHLYWSGNGTSPFPMDSGPLISAISIVRIPDRKRLSTTTIAGITASSLFFVAVVLLLLWKFCRKKPMQEELKATELFPGGVYTFRQIKAATQNFNAANKLGEGGFGTVYKGVLPNGTAIAVKQLSTKSKQGAREFVNEIGTISSLQHPNLVKLMGCCAEDNELVLVYEYMENNSLNYALFGDSEELRSRLNWSTRVKIILGIAQGLKFLHEESRLKIIHRDIKPTNILLDKDLNAKITDFGYAKLNVEGTTHVITRVAGTTGYMAPEYAMRGYLTPKADVYSFGVVTLEIVSGRNSATYRPSDQTVYLLDLAYVLHEQQNLMELVDRKLGTDYTEEEADTILELAMMCTNPSPTLRPTMSEVVDIIEGKTKMKKTTPTSSMTHRSTEEIALTRAVAALSNSSQSESNSMAGPSSSSAPNPSSFSNTTNISNEI